MPVLLPPDGLARLRAAIAAAAPGPLGPGTPLLAIADGHATAPGDIADGRWSTPRGLVPVGPPDGGGPALSAPPRANGPDPSRIEALVELAKVGDREAFAEIYDTYLDSVYRYVYFRVGSHALAEDLTSETFLRALRRIGSFTWQGSDIGAWFVTIARNLVADHVKSSRFRLEVPTADLLDADRGDEGIEDTVLNRLQNAALLDAVRALKPEQQECIVLRFLEGLSVAQTAAVMRRSEGAVKQLQLRAVRALARRLDGVTQPGAVRLPDRGSPVGEAALDVGGGA